MLETFSMPWARIAFAPADSTVKAWAVMNSGVSIGVPSLAWQETMSPLFMARKTGFKATSLCNLFVTNYSPNPLDFLQPYYSFTSLV
jgi:hypothetical protein